MPYRICKTFDIESGHMLSKHPGKCRFPHGHTRKIEFVLEADDLDANGMVCDFKIVRETMDTFLETYDHSMCMNTGDPQYAAMKASFGDRIVGFPGVDPTTEVIAKAFCDHFRQRLAEYTSSPLAGYPLRTSVRVVKVRVWETATSWAEFRP